MLTALIDGLLHFSNASIMLIIIILGWIFYDRKIFFYAACLCCLSVIINVALKGTFKIPLPPHLPPGYAFPSGHMQISTVFYGWLFYNMNHRGVRILISILLVTVAIGMFIKNYHNITEILAGFVTGIILIRIFVYAKKRYVNKLEMGLFVTACIFMGYDVWIYAIIPVYTWVAFGLLTVFLLSSRLCSHSCLFFQQTQGNEIFEDKEKHQEK